MKAILPILGFISALWIFGGSYWISNMSCGSSNAATFSVTDGDFKTQSTDMYTFGFSGAKPSSFGSGMGKSFKEIADYLKNNENRKLLLTGNYGANEKIDPDFENLGVARAEWMKGSLVNKGAPVDQIETTGNEVNNLSFDKKKNMPGGVSFLFMDMAAEPAVEEPRSTDDESSSSMSFSEDGNLVLNISDSNFDLDDYQGFDSYLEELQTYMDNNTDKQLRIDCYNDDSDVGDNIGRKIRTYMADKMGYKTNRFYRYSKIQKASSSISGEPNVTLYIR